MLKQAASRLLVSGIDDAGDVVHFVVQVTAWKATVDEDGQVVQTPVYNCPEAADLRYSVARPIRENQAHGDTTLRIMIRNNTRMVDDAYAEDCAKWDAKEQVERSYIDFHSKLEARDWEGLGWFKRQTPPEGIFPN